MAEVLTTTENTDEVVLTNPNAIRLGASPILSELKTSINSKLQLEWEDTDTEKIYEVLFESIGRYLKIKKTKECKTAIAIQDLKGNNIMAAVVEFIPNENESMPGNWALSFTFDNEDLAGLNTIYTTTDNAFKSIQCHTMLEIVHYHYALPRLQEDINRTLAEVLRDTLLRNAAPGSEFIIELPNYFVAKSTVEGEHKILAIEASTSLSRSIKGDDHLTM